MTKRIFKVDRNIHLAPKKELKYIIFLFLIIVYLFVVVELLSKDQIEYLRGQGKIVYGLFMIFLARLFTIKQWMDKYKETLNFLLGSVRFDSFVAVSILNILLDFFILFCLFFWIDIEKVSFIPVTVAGVVYLLMFGFAFLKQVFSTKKTRKQEY